MDYGFIFLMTGALAADLASIERAVLADAQQRVQLGGDRCAATGFSDVASRASLIAPAQKR